MNDIKMDRMEVGFGAVDWILMAQESSNTRTGLIQARFPYIMQLVSLFCRLLLNKIESGM
jgi:hypothetical protein